MSARVGLAGVLALAVSMIFLSVGRIAGHTAFRPYSGSVFSFELGATPAILTSIDGGHLRADVVNLQSPDAALGPIVCRLVVVFYDAKGGVLQSSELNVGPGETGSVALSPQNAPSLVRATFQVLDDGSGKPKPCLAIPSVQLVDGKTLRTTALVPVITR